MNKKLILQLCLFFVIVLLLAFAGRDITWQLVLKVVLATVLTCWMILIFRRKKKH